MNFNRLIIAAGLLAVAAIWSPALAQPAQQAPEYTITLTGQEWFFIGEAIADRPFKQANPILAKINQQISAIVAQRQKDEAEAQAKAKAAPPPAEAPAKSEEKPQ